MEYVDRCEAWWIGDPAGLAAEAASTPQNRPSQSRGGVVGTLSRFWFGKPTETATSTRPLHIPIAKDIAQMCGNLLYSKPPTAMIAAAVTDEDGKINATDQAAQDRLDRIMNTAQFHSSLLVAGETGSALSGTFPRIVWDEDVVQNAWIDFVDPDRAIPEFAWDRLIAVTFWTVLASPDDRVVWRHLERYEIGRIVHGLYKGTDADLGPRVDLTMHTATANLITDADGAVETGSPDRLAAGYIPNMRPNPIWRKVPELKHLGASDLAADVIALMERLDEVWSSLMRDLRLGRGRVIVSEQLLTTLGAGKGSGFDLDREVFSPVGTAIGGDGTATTVMEAHQFEIRMTEHLGIATALVLEILRRTGYSPITFGMDEGGSATTATEIEARQKASKDTYMAKTRLVSSALSALGRTLLEVDAAQFPATKVTVTEDLEIQWPPFTEDSTLALARTLQALHGAEAVSIAVKVKMLNPDWDDKRVQDEVALIKADRGMQLPDLGGMGMTDFPARKGLPDDDTVEDGTKDELDE